MSQYDFSLIIPCYNFSAGIQKTLDRVLDWKNNKSLNFFLCLVDDGSTDDTLKFLQRFQKENPAWCKIHEIKINKGKGNAIREAAKICAPMAKYTIFTDCDLYYGLHIIHERILPSLKNDADLVMLDRSWSKQFHSSSMIRKFLSHCFTHLKTILTAVPFEDSQAGLKGFTSEFISSTIPITKVNGFAFDVEILSIAILFRYRVERIPILLNSDQPPEKTSITATKAVKMLLDLFHIAISRYSGAYYSKSFENRIHKSIYEIKKETDGK